MGKKSILRAIIIILSIFLCSLWLEEANVQAHSPHDVINAIKMSPIYNKDQTVWIIIKNTWILKSLDGGYSWKYLSNGLGHKFLLTSLSVSPSFETDKTLFLSSKGDGVFKSTDSGDNWTNIGLSEVNAISVDPGNHDVVYAGTANGIYASTDGGTSWDVMNDGLEDLNINSLGISPGTYLFCGADVGGMYRWDIYTGMEELAGHHTTNVLRATPNPMRHNTTIAYHLSKDSRVRLSIYDAQGRLIDELVNTQVAAGAYQQYWDCTDTYGLPVAAGVYFCRLTVGGSSDLVKLVVTQ